MAKTVISTRIEDNLLDDLKAIQERNRWSFQTVVELAVEQFVARYSSVQIPGLVEDPTEESPTQQMKNNGASPLLAEAA